ncbi:MAG: nickel pincer cofactor biosynthesis protein LarB [Candidatus Mcinerneyibacterium aminivorans]|uniref:Nickel pincer cofactor biosynthesis protein LarB n=1 Tax=Candidatus Mcinerneyibacterium aminivorans TaxID=2703815 RepID=A0A5D0MAP8_9BACT|nr:MAG: nickel pincer cofactor biosynthesis protein LarB [Candidatus Mcinerneyibacterium aminivorans]
MEKLKNLPFEDLGFAKVDHHRTIRKGHPEVIYCGGKTLEEIESIVEKMIEKKSNVILTRVDKQIYKRVKSVSSKAEYHERAGIVLIEMEKVKKSRSKLLVVSAGTSDINVAEEAALTAEVMGTTTERLYDVGVAGIHRLFLNKSKLDEANVIIVVAGMEGALPSVVGGLVDKPVIAVPTSVGYGVNFEGVAPLLTMLNSCASGIGVVNIDNGFGAGYLASTIIRQIEKAGEKK